VGCHSLQDSTNTGALLPSVCALSLIPSTEKACHSLQDSTNTGALLPSVCALSLIPRAGRKHMPQLLQPLMDDDSPVADVFDSCSICDQLTLENSQVSTVSASFVCLRVTDNKRNRIQAESRWPALQPLDNAGMPCSRAEAACGRVCHADPFMTPQPCSKAYITWKRGTGS